MDFLKPVIDFDRFIRGLLFLAVITVLVLGLRWLSPVLIPFFAAWAIAWILAPVVNFFQSTCRLRSRVLSVLITLALLIGLASAVAWLIIPPLIDGVTQIKEALLSYLASGHIRNIHLPEWLDHLMQQWLDQGKIQSMLRSDNLMKTIRETLPHVWNMLVSTANLVMSLVGAAFGALYLFFLLLDYDYYTTAWINWLPRTQRNFFRRLSEDLGHNMRGYFRGQALVALSNCVMFTLGFWVIGLPMPLGMGLFVGLISFIPYVQVVGFAPAAVLALMEMSDTGRSFWGLMALVLLVYIVVQVLQDTVFTPRIMGKIMGLSSAMVLLSLSIWSYMAGIIGLIIALPLTTIIFAYYKRYILKEPDDMLNEAHEQSAASLAAEEA
ncbi:MAG: AI-2E family transporter [Prevotellaceae bacterium]|nr:AI-2E family transporter [Prevotellaceae bacterium]